MDNTQGSDAGSSSQRGDRGRGCGRGRGDNTAIDTVVEGYLQNSSLEVQH